VTERITLITGASAGIGTELARVFAANGHRLALTARRADRLTALAGEITAAGGAEPSTPTVLPISLQPAAVLQQSAAVSVANQPTSWVAARRQAYPRPLRCLQQ